MTSFELEGRNLRLVATPDAGGFSTGPPSDEPTFTERILALRVTSQLLRKGYWPSLTGSEHKTMDEARAANREYKQFDSRG
jgi:hypothetical protein